MRITMKDIDRESLQHNKLPGLVLDKLMEWIMSGKLSMGDKLNTEDLARQFGVSRMPIREALVKLEKTGLAESRPYAGTWLVTLTKEDVRQIYIARMALEPMASTYACQKIGEKEIAVLREIHKDYMDIVRTEEMDALNVYRQNRLFHFTIYKASQLTRVCEMIESLWDTLSFFKLIYGQKLLDEKETRERLIWEHKTYLDALENHDALLIRSLMERDLMKRSEDIPYYSDAYFHEETKKIDACL